MDGAVSVFLARGKNREEQGSVHTWAAAFGPVLELL